MKQRNFSVGTAVRTVVLALALINQMLAVNGKSPLPFTDEQLVQGISVTMTALTALCAWWKNNSFTRAAVMADGVLERLRGEDASTVSVSVAQREG